jgi:hypothetical protein
VWPSFRSFWPERDRWIPAFAGMTDRRGQREFETYHEPVPVIPAEAGIVRLKAHLVREV